VRSALVWLGLADPVSTMEGARSEDPVRQARLQVFAAWAAELGVAAGYQTFELVELAEQETTIGFKIVPARPRLHEALLAVAGKRHGNPAQLDSLRLAHWLNRNVNTIAGDFKLLVDRSDRRRLRWQVRRGQQIGGIFAADHAGGARGGSSSAVASGPGAAIGHWQIQRGCN
jgi:hypothetical protein